MSEAVFPPSFERIDYALRPAKNIERKMMCEALARLSRIAPLKVYTYVGFGSIGFHDFVLFHQRLGIKSMTSVEGHDDAKDRVQFNRPYSCIKMEWGQSHVVLPTMDWSRRVIVWLDYDKALDAAKLEDIRHLIGCLKSGSLLIVSVNVDTPQDSGQQIHSKRLDKLKQHVGKAKIRADVTGAQLAGWGLAKVCRDIMHDHIEETLSWRNGPVSTDAAKLNYTQLFNFHYRDGAKMLTVGGLLSNARDRKRLNISHFRDLDFIRGAESVDPCLIEVPILTLREMRFMDERLPRNSSGSYPKWLPPEHRQRYSKLYRYFPSFSEMAV